MNEDNIQVLILDDDPDDTYIINQMLTSEAGTKFRGFNVSDLNEVENITKSIKIDALLLDLDVNDDSSLEKLEKCINLSKDKPIVVLASDDDEGFGNKVVAHGAQDSIPKLFLSPESLSRSIRFAILRKQIEER